jgi:hypothetical protein
MKSLTNILNKSHVGDWFVLYQLSKNVDSFFFRMFINELEKGMRDDASIQIQPPTPSEKSDKRTSRRNSNRNSKTPFFLRPSRSEVSIEVESASDSEPKKIDEEPEPEDGTFDV